MQSSSDRESVHQLAKEIVEKHGFLPPVAFFGKSGDAEDRKFFNLLHRLYQSEEGFKYEELKLTLGASKEPKYWSRDNKWWRSMAEASMANFLYARGVKYEVGKKYPQHFKDQFGHSAWYDLHIETIHGTVLDVEIWGDAPGGRSEKYAETRIKKEEFAEKQGNFLGVHFTSCYNEDALIKILAPYIGEREIINATSEADRRTKSTNWSLMDEVLKNVKKVKDFMGYVPSEPWFRRRGHFKNRKSEEWEEQIDFNLHSLSKMINTVGGFRLVRSLLGCEESESRIKWTEETALAELWDLYQYTKITPIAYYEQFKSDEEKKTILQRCIRVKEACKNQVEGGYRGACEKLGIPIRKYSERKKKQKLF